MIMTKEKFKNLAMEILFNEEFGISGMARLFDSDNIDNFKVAQYDDAEWTVEASLPLEEFLDELYTEIFINPPKPKYKEGDVVKIRRDLVTDYNKGIVPEMEDLAGKTTRIEEVDIGGIDDDMPYRISADNGTFWWAERWFE